MSRALKGLPLSAAALAVGRLAVPVLNAGVVVQIARVHGPNELGAYALLTGLFALVDQMRLLGLPTLVTREVAGHGPAANGIVRAYIAVGLLSAGVSAVVFSGYAVASGHHELMVPAAILAVAFFPSTWASANDALFLAHRRADLLTTVLIAEATARGVASVLVVRFVDADIRWLAAIHATGRLLAAYLGTRMRRGMDTAPLQPDWYGARSLLAKAPAFVTINTVPLLLMRGDIALLGSIVSTAELGQYSAAARIVALILLFPDALLAMNFTRLSRVATVATTSKPFWDQVLQPAVTAITISAVFAIAMMFAARQVSAAIFGPGFEASAGYLTVLVWVAPLFCAARVVGDALIAQREQQALAVALWAAAALGVPCSVFVAFFQGAGGMARMAVLNVAAMLLSSALAMFVRLRRGSPAAATLSLS